MWTTNIKEIWFILLAINPLVLHSEPQLDLPAITTDSNPDKPDIKLTSFTEDHDANEEARGGSHNYDSDRSQRFGPPYSLDNIEGAPPTGGYDRLPARSHDRDYPNRLSDDRNYPNRPGDPIYPIRSPGDDQSNRPPSNEGRNYPNTFGYFDSRARPNGDDDKYYRDPNRFGDYDRNNNPVDVNNGVNGDFERNRHNQNTDNRFDDRERNRDYNRGEVNGVNGADFDRNRQNPDGNRYYDRPNSGYPNNDGRPQFDDDRYRFEQERINRVETAKLRRLLAEVDTQSSLECSLNVQAQWNFETNVNEVTQLHALKGQQRYADFQRVVWDEMRHINKDQILDPKLHRQVTLMSNIGASALQPDQLDRYNRIVNDMLAIYNKAEICRFEQPFNCGLRLQPDLKEIMATSRDWEELQYTWQEFRRKSGRDMKDLFEQMVDLTNEAARQNNFSSAAEYWTFPFESPDFRRESENVWQEILPLYELIHAYVRRKLREFYGPDRINRNAPLPDHVLGNMYGQTWSNILDITLPYPGRHFHEVTPAMLAQGYTPHVMFQLAEDFFHSINMTVLPADFWLDSVIEQPPDRTILCQPSAWDFCNGHDYRIKMCTHVTHKDLITVHHEMTHIQYFVSYRNNPKVFRDGANSAFHEALGDAVALSVATPKHLQSLGLIQKSVDDTAHDINFLFALAMDKVVFLPFALSLDAWRWDIFNKAISKEQYNCHWWLLRERYGGIKPPVLRSEMDFDPGAKYHVPANIPYIRYFVSTVLQFQIHRAMCRTTGQYDPNNPQKPLHKCDIYRQPEAGNILKKIMEKGAEKPWQEVLQEVIGEGRLDGSALREYFRPLEDWLRNENLRNNEFVGWIYDGDYCKHSIDTANLQVYGGFYNGAQSLNHNLFELLISMTLIVVYKLTFVEL